MWSSTLKFGLFYFFGIWYAAKGSDWGQKKWQEICPAIFDHTFTSFAPIGNLSAGVFKKTMGLYDLKSCVIDCCTKSTCNVALMYNRTCYHVRCASTKLCLPLYRGELVNENPPIMVLVKPVEDDEGWSSYMHVFNKDDNDIARYK